MEREQLLAVGKTDEAAAVKIDIIDFPAELKVLTDTLPLYRTASAEFAVKLMAALDKAPQMPTPNSRPDWIVCGNSQKITSPRSPRRSGFWRPGTILGRFLGISRGFRLSRANNG